MLWLALRVIGGICVVFGIGLAAFSVSEESGAGWLGLVVGFGFVFAGLLLWRDH